MPLAQRPVPGPPPATAAVLAAAALWVSVADAEVLGQFNVRGPDQLVTPASIDAAVARALAAHTARASTASPDDEIIIRVPAGTWDITDARAPLFNFTDHGDKDAAWVVVAGAGMDATTLITSPSFITIYAVYSWKLRFENMTLARAGPTTTQGRVVDATNTTVIVALEEGYPNPLEHYRSDQEERWFRRFAREGADGPCRVIQDPLRAAAMQTWPPTYNRPLPWIKAISPSANPRVWELVLNLNDIERRTALEIQTQDLIAIRSAYQPLSYYHYGGAYLQYNRVRWEGHSKGVVRGGASYVTFNGCRVERPAGAPGQCLATNADGIVVGSVEDPSSQNIEVLDHVSTGQGGDAIYFENVGSGRVTNAEVSDSFGRGLAMVGCGPVRLVNNNFTRCTFIASDALQTPLIGGASDVEGAAGNDMMVITLLVILVLLICFLLIFVVHRWYVKKNQPKEHVPPPVDPELAQRKLRGMVHAAKAVNAMKASPQQAAAKYMVKAPMGEAAAKSPNGVPRDGQFPGSPGGGAAGGVAAAAAAADDDNAAAGDDHNHGHLETDDESDADMATDVPNQLLSPKAHGSPRSGADGLSTGSDSVVATPVGTIGSPSMNGSGLRQFPTASSLRGGAPPVPDAATLLHDSDGEPDTLRMSGSPGSRRWHHRRTPLTSFATPTAGGAGTASDAALSTGAAAVAVGASMGTSEAGSPQRPRPGVQRRTLPSLTLPMAAREAALRDENRGPSPAPSYGSDAEDAGGGPGAKGARKEGAA